MHTSAKHYSIILTVATTGMAAAPSSWGQGQAVEGPQLEEVLVTAQRRTTDLQSTAAAISAYSDDDLRLRSIADAESLGHSNSSMDVAFFQGEAQVYIRGIGSSGIVGGTDSSTALHSNGVYLSRSSTAVPAFLDVERVEVVKGPQGTLYGRNATGGSVNVISKKPTDEFEAEVSALIGTYNRKRVTAIVSGALVEDSVLARLAIQKENRDGFTTVYRPDGSSSDIEDKDDIMARLSLQYIASDTVTMDIVADYYKADDAASAWIFINPGTNSFPPMRKYVQDRGGFLPESKSRKFGSDLEHYNKLEIWGLSAKLNWEMSPESSFSSLTAYKDTRPLNRNDLDATSVFGVDQLREEDHQQFSQEFQFSYTGDTFNSVVGLYYFSEDNDIRNEYFLPFTDDVFGFANDDSCCLLSLNGSSNTKAYAAFGEVNWTISDKLDVVLGARYGSETRGGDNAVVYERTFTPAFDNVSELDDKKFSAFTPKIGVNYTASDDVFLYASVSEGFKSGGYNIGSYQNDTFDPEQITAWEVGMRADLLDHRLRLNTTAFYYDYQDLQIQDTENNNTVVRNAANAETYGLEFEGAAVLTEAFQIDFAATLLNSEFKDIALIDPKYPDLGLQDLEGNQLPRAPKYKLVLGLQYQIELEDGGSLTFRGDYSKQSKVYFSAFNLDGLGQKGYDWLKAKVSYKSPDEQWELSAFGDNLGNEVVVSNATFTGNIIDSIVVGNLAPPRTFGLEMLFRF